MTRWPLVLLLLTGLATFPAGGKVEAKDITDKLALSGFLEYEIFSAFEEAGAEAIDGRNEMQLHASLSYRANRFVRLYVAPEFRFDDADPERNRIFLDEAYVDLVGNYSELRVGHFMLPWGQADSLRPTDIWRLRDYTDLFAVEEEGLSGVRLRYVDQPATLDLILVPFFQRDALPLTDPRNPYVLLPRGVLSGGLIPGLKSTEPYVFDYVELTDGLPEDSLASFEVGLRVALELQGVDLSFMYAYAHDRLPTTIEGLDLLEAPIIVADDPDAGPGFGRAVLGLRPRYERIHLVGVDGAAPLGPLNLRLEAAYVVTADPDGSDPAIDDPYLRATVGVDTTFSNVLGGQDILFLVQYALDRELPRRGPSNLSSAGPSLRHFFENALTLLVDWQISSFFTFKTEAFYNVDNGDQLVRPTFGWSPAAGLTFEARMTLLSGGGDPSTFIGLYEDRDRVEVAARFSL